MASPGVSTAGPGLLAVGAAGAALVLVTLLDVFVTIFNYDGFTFLSARFHHLLWRAIRRSSRLLPNRVRTAALSLGSAAMLPATIAMWIGLEIIGFAMMYVPGVARGDFALKHHLPRAAGTAFYLSAGDISSLTFGDVQPLTSLYQALSVVETGIGLATLTLALTYILSALDVLNHVDRLHGRVRRNAEDPEHPSSVLARHFRSPNTSQLPAMLRALAEDLEHYDQGLRRFPVVYYFHTRRVERSVPYVFAALGEMIAMARWGLPPDEPLTDDAALLALSREYLAMVARLRRSFDLSPGEIEHPVDEEHFAIVRRGERRDAGVDVFTAMEKRARDSARISGPVTEADDSYRRYREWFPFAQQRRAFVVEVSRSLGYEAPTEPREIRSE